MSDPVRDAYQLERERLATKSANRKFAARSISFELQRLQSYALGHGLPISAQAIGNAANALGWEAADEPENAAKAGRGERPGE